MCFSTARLNAAVVLSPRYPEVSPLFSICLSWKGERTGHTDDNLRVGTFFFFSLDHVRDANYRLI